MQQDALKKHLQRRLRRDRNASWLIHFGGWLVIAALLVLLWHLISVVLPMFRYPEIVVADKLGVDVQGSIVYQAKMQETRVIVTQGEDCDLVFSQKMHSQSDFQFFKRIPLPCDEKVLLHEANGSHYLLQLAENKILRISELTFLGSEIHLQRIYSSLLPELVTTKSSRWKVNHANGYWVLSFGDVPDWQLFWLDPNNLNLPKIQTLINAEKLSLLPDNSGVLVSQGKQIRLLDRDSKIKWEKELPSEVEYLMAVPSGKGFIVQLSDNSIQKWTTVNRQSGLHYELAYQIDVFSTIQQILFFPQKMMGLIHTEENLFLFNSTTGKLLNTQSWQATVNEEDLGRFVWQESRLVWLSDTALIPLDIHNSNSSLTLENMFSPIWYEGYQSPKNVWQSTPGADNGEAKYSVIPLMMGSVKAAIIAIVVALPLGLGAAVYTAYFAPEVGRQWLKPAIEMLEAIPSVVLGFIAAVWLLPLAEGYLVALLSFFILLPLFAFIFTMINRVLMKSLGRSLPVDLPFCFIYLLVFASVLSVIVPSVMGLLSDWQLPAIFFLEEVDTHSKNTVVVALALGVAIAPSIYSLAEDAIYEVPVALRRASYALGATRVQTLLNVVLKVAYPGILSALMLGFSRALGETMILLMVTGNTPIAEWDFMAGMRTLTANLAIELPESEVGGIHYQVLFLTALLLLIFTMSINTVAELLRLRLRKKYRHE